MSEATVKALTDAIYDRLTELDITRDLDKEQVYEVARVAAQTIESAGTTKSIIRAWLEEQGLTPAAAAVVLTGVWAEAVKAMQL